MTNLALVHERNRKKYDTGTAADLYARHYGNAGLMEGEKRIFQHLEAQIRGKDILDLGVGGGRTTPFLSEIGGHYLGVDYAEAMVKRCRERFPGIEFRCGDARHMPDIDGDSFDVVVFSYNGIDSCSIGDREKVLREVHRILRPSGIFIFSSHNIHWHPPTPSFLPTLHFERNPIRMARRNCSLLLRQGATIFHYLKNLRYTIETDEYALRVDDALNYQLLHVYVRPSYQVSQLGALGFNEIELFGLDGAELKADASTADPWVHYTARKRTYNAA